MPLRSDLDLNDFVWCEARQMTESVTNSLTNEQ